MKIGELVQRVISLYQKGTPSDDNRLTVRHVYNKLLTTRSKIISQGLYLRKRLSSFNYQTISCLELINVPNFECDCISAIGCGVLRSKYKIPKTLLGLGYNGLVSVATLDGKHKYSEIQSYSRNYSKGNKYSKADNNVYYLQNEYLYVPDIYSAKLLSITGLFEDPVEALSYPTYCGNNSNNNELECISMLDREFPIEAGMVEVLIENTLQELINIFPKMIEDISNNSKDGITEQSK